MSHHNKPTAEELAAMPRVIFNAKLWHSLYHSMTDADRDHSFEKTFAAHRGATKWIRGNLRVTTYPTKSNNIYTMGVTVYDCFNVYVRIRIEFLRKGAFEELADTKKLGSFATAQEVQVLEFNLRENRTIEDMEHELTVVVLTKGH